MEVSSQSSFTAYELTEQETIQGNQFSSANKAVIQNLISAYAEEIILIRLDGGIPSPEEQHKLAYSAGAIAALKHLLSAGKVVEEQLVLQRQQAEEPDKTF